MSYTYIIPTIYTKCRVRLSFIDQEEEIRAAETRLQKLADLLRQGLSLQQEFVQKMSQFLMKLPSKLVDFVDSSVQAFTYWTSVLFLISEYFICLNRGKDLPIEQKLYINRPLTIKKKRRHKPGGCVPLSTTKLSLVSSSLNTVATWFAVNSAVKRRKKSCLEDNHVNLYLNRLKVPRINKIQYQPNEGSLVLAKMHICEK